MLADIDRYAIFVTSQDNKRMIMQRVMTLTSSNPHIFIVSGMGAVSKIVKSLMIQLENLLKDYELERVSGGNKEILFFKRRLII